MLKRKIEKELEMFHSDTSRKALLRTGARQVGKTFSIREFGKGHYESFVEINFIRDREAVNIFRNVSDERDILLRISVMSKEPLIPGKTLIFFDEVQVCPEIITYIKFLVEEGSFRYILSGSLLGVELKSIRSVPVGYMNEVQLFPLDFEEFIRANGIGDDVVAHLRNAFEERKSPDKTVHDRMMRFHALYLITGGMPAVVQKYIDTNDLRQVIEEQSSIVQQYLRDITQYDERLKMRLRHIYSLIPSELNQHNKRFYLKNVSERGRFDRAEADFVWLKEAGVAIPVYNVDRALDQEIHTYLTLCNFNATNPNRDTTKEAIFELVDEEAKAEKESRTRNVRREALNAAADMSPEEVKDYAAALGKDDSKPVSVLRNELEEMADKTPEDFMKLINNKQAAMKA